MRERKTLSSYKLAVLISGSGSNLQAVLDAINDGRINKAEVALVVSNRAGAYGLERAKKHDIPTMVIDKSNTSELLSALNAYEIDGIVLAGYLSILPPEIINIYSGKIINIHPALLPMFGGKGFYGIRVHQAVLASGVPFSGATVHLVDCGIDTGAVLVRGVVPVLPDDTAEDLQKRVLMVEHDILVMAVKAMAQSRIEEMTARPAIFVDEKDKAGVLEFAKGLKELGEALKGS